MILNNFKNQGAFTANATAETTNWNKYLALIAGNDVSATDTTTTEGGTVTALANNLISTTYTTQLGKYYATASATPTTLPTFWPEKAVFEDVYGALTNTVTTSVTAANLKLLFHKLIFLQKTLSTYSVTWSATALKTQLAAGSGSAWTTSGNATTLRQADITDFTSLASIVAIFDTNATLPSTYWHTAYFAPLASTNVYASVATFTLSVATSVTVQAPEPVAVEEPVVEAIPQIEGLSTPYTGGPIVGATFNNPDPSVSGFLRSDQFTSKWLALGACPRKKDVCGTRDIAVGSSETTISIGGTTAMTHLDQCTYILKDASGIPQVKLKTVSSGSLAKYKIAFVEFDDKWATPAAITMDTTLTTVPDKATAVNWVDDVFAYNEGTLGLFK